MVIEGILEESLSYYLNRQRSIVGAILGIPRGALRAKKKGDCAYWCLHGRTGRKTS